MCNIRFDMVLFCKVKQMNELDLKLRKNSLVLERMVKLTKEQRQAIVLDLLMTKTERQLGEELNISHSVIHDWKTLRQNNIGANIHISLDAMIRKMKEWRPETREEKRKLRELFEIIKGILA